MNFFIIFNSLLSACVAGVLTYKLIYYSDRTGCAERVGMALIGAAMIMNIGPILAKAGMPFGEGHATPFDDWVSSLLRVGLAIYFVARVLHHWRANRAQLANSYDYFRNKR